MLEASPGQKRYRVNKSQQTERIYSEMTKMQVLNRKLLKQKTSDACNNLDIHIFKKLFYF